MRLPFLQCRLSPLLPKLPCSSARPRRFLCAGRLSSTAAEAMAPWSRPHRSGRRYCSSVLLAASFFLFVLVTAAGSGWGGGSLWPLLTPRAAGLPALFFFLLVLYAVASRLPRGVRERALMDFPIKTKARPSPLAILLPAQSRADCKDASSCEGRQLMAPLSPACTRSSCLVPR